MCFVKEAGGRLTADLPFDPERPALYDDLDAGAYAQTVLAMTIVVVTDMVGMGQPKAVFEESEQAVACTRSSIQFY